MKSALIIALLCASTVAASAQDDPTWNAGVRGSLAFGGSADAKANVTPPLTAKADLNVGGGASFFWGASLPSGFDAELEFLYRYMPLGDVTLNGVALVPQPDGNVQMFAPMANIYWTFPVDLPVKPYIGGGAGYAWTDAKIGGINDHDWHLAYNLMAGVAIPAGNGARFTVGYRWLHENVKLDCGSIVSCSGNMNSNSVEVGLVMDLH